MIHICQFIDPIAQSYNRTLFNKGLVLVWSRLDVELIVYFFSIGMTNILLERTSMIVSYVIFFIHKSHKFSTVVESLK